jgi:ribonuclease Z
MTLDPLHNPGLPLELRFGELALTAFSISGLATYVLAPGLDACFDLGHCPFEATKLRHVFLSHVHQDHSDGAHRHLSLRRMLGRSSSRIFCPSASAEPLRALLHAWDRLEEQPFDDTLGEVVHGLDPGDVVSMGRHRRVQAFDVVHRIASLGYSVIETRHKLRPEWAGRPGAEIHAARQRGERVADEQEHKVFTYIGDSTIDTLRRHPEVGDSEVLFLEATHLGETDPEISRRWGHTHLDELVALWRERPAVLASPHLVIKHFSTRYARSQIEAAAETLPEGLRERVTLLV